MLPYNHLQRLSMNQFLVAAKHARIAGGEKRNVTACIPVVDVVGEMWQMAVDGKSLGIGRQAEWLRFPQGHIHPELTTTMILLHRTVQTFLNSPMGDDPHPDLRYSQQPAEVALYRPQ